LIGKPETRNSINKVKYSLEAHWTKPILWLTLRVSLSKSWARWPLWQFSLSGLVNAWLLFDITIGECLWTLIGKDIKFEPYSITTHRKILRDKGVLQVERDDYNEYPYRSHGQPLLAYLAFSGCLFLLVIAGGAALWKGFHLLPFVAPYLTVRRCDISSSSVVTWSILTCAAAC
jgi:hypothetical protein